INMSSNTLLYLLRRLMHQFLCNFSTTPNLYPLSLHDALPICHPAQVRPGARRNGTPPARSGSPHAVAPAAAQAVPVPPPAGAPRSEEHTSELQSRENLVCRLLLEKKKIVEGIKISSATTRLRK